MGRGCVIENPHGRTWAKPLKQWPNRGNLCLPVIATGISWQHGLTVCRLPREQSVASRLGRHQTLSAKSDGKCITPAVSPGGFSPSGFLVSGVSLSVRARTAATIRACSMPARYRPLPFL